MPFHTATSTCISTACQFSLESHMPSFPQPSDRHAICLAVDHNWYTVNLTKETRSREQVCISVLNAKPNLGGGRFCTTSSQGDFYLK